MSGDDGRRSSPLLLPALAGLEAGILGGVAMLVWFTVGSALRGSPPWIVANLLGVRLYGRALRAGFGMQSIAGMAMLLAAAGLIGVVFAILIGRHPNRVRVALLAILAGLVWYYFSQAYFWNRMGILAGVHVPPAMSMLAHLAYGAVLAGYPGRLRRLERSVAEPPGEQPPKA